MTDTPAPVTPRCPIKFDCDGEKGHEGDHFFWHDGPHYFGEREAAAPAATEALRAALSPYTDHSDGSIHVDRTEDVPAFLEAIRAALASPEPTPDE